MKSSSASSEGTFYYWSVPLLSMEMNDCVIHRSHCTPEQIEVPSTKSTNRLQRHCKAVPHTVWGGRGQDMVPSTEQNRFTTPIPKHSALPGNASSLLTPSLLLTHFLLTSYCIPEMKAEIFQIWLPVPVVSTLHIKGRNPFIIKVTHKRVAVQYFSRTKTSVIIWHSGSLSSFSLHMQC